MGHSINVLVLGETDVLIRKIFISVPTKLLILIVVTLLLISIGFSVISLDRLKDEFLKFRQDTLIQRQSQFNLHNEVLRSKLEGWLESFVDINALNEHDNFDTLIEGLNQQFDRLQLSLNVENMWLINQQLQPVFATAALPDFVIKNVTEALIEESPKETLYCAESCQQLVSIPVMNKKGEFAIVAISASIIDSLYAINRSLKGAVGIVSFDDVIGTTLKSGTILSASQPRLLKDIFNTSSTSLSVDEVKRNGLQIDFVSSHYLLNLIPLANNQRQYYLALADDVSSIKVSLDDYREHFLIWVVIILYILSLLVYLLAWPFSKKLLVLSRALPLLSEKKFDQFRQIKQQNTSVFSDELDTLTDATIELSYELEQLSIAINQKTKALEHIAMYDPLTGLPNRNKLNEYLHELLNGRQTDKKGMAVLFLDLDDFKKVNDSYGHSEGDQLLIVAASRLRRDVSTTDFICRFGGNAFVIVLSQLTSVVKAKKTAKEILLQFREPITLSSGVFYVSTSIGIVYSEDGNTSADHLISHADIAMYEAKNNGGAQYYNYYDDLSQKITRKVMLEGEVRQALIKKQFSLKLQPQLQPRSRKIYGFEALLRWDHPQRGIISPVDFIPAIAQSANIVILGYWVIRRCFKLCVDIHAHGFNHARITINLSSVQFTDPKLVRYFCKLLSEFNLKAEYFELEITEKTLVKNVEQTIKIMGELKSMGFTLAIDDFGTGHSSLSYLKKLPVDVIKIDKRLVLGMLENDDDYQMVIATIATVKKLGLTVLACGVESHQQLTCLMENSCDLIQGNYFFKPVHENEILTFIDEYTFEGYCKKSMTELDEQYNN